MLGLGVRCDISEGAVTKDGVPGDKMDKRFEPCTEGEVESITSEDEGERGNGIATATGTDGSMNGLSSR